MHELKLTNLELLTLESVLRWSVRRDPDGNIRLDILTKVVELVTKMEDEKYGVVR